MGFIHANSIIVVLSPALHQTTVAMPNPTHSKIMIARPEGTPYSGGLFEFDCFIPLEYPNKPPLFHLRTTGGGTVRFNPNLYNNGKVCLSLLGTLAGRCVVRHLYRHCLN